MTKERRLLVHSSVVLLMGAAVLFWPTSAIAAPTLTDYCAGGYDCVDQCPGNLETLCLACPIASPNCNMDSRYCPSNLLKLSCEFAS